MLTYTGRRNLYGDLTNDDSAANLTLGDTLMNESEREIVGLRSWPFLERLYTVSTVADQQFYQIPSEIDKVLAATVTIGNIKYTPDPSPSIDFWNWLNTTTVVTSDIPEWWYVQDGKIGFYPKPANTTADAITIVGRRRQRDLGIADYTTGTITTATNGSTAIVGNGTSWNASMVGAYIRITASNAANVGDGQWYEIAAVGSTTALTLTKNYFGTSIAAGTAAYTIGHSGLLPEDYDILPVYKATELYFTSVHPLPGQADRYKQLYNERFAGLVRSWGRISDNPVLKNVRNVAPLNPNLTISY